LLREVGDLKADEQVYRDQLLGADEELPRVKALAEEFTRIVRSRDRAGIGAWLQQAEGSGVGEFRQFALVLRRDLAAVEAALTYGWSNGQTEGQINRLKLLKRQMYGQASLGLLRRRFLQAA
jgi:transposase